MVDVPLLALENISKCFGEKKQGVVAQTLQRLHLVKAPQVTAAVNHVDLSIFKGEVVGLVGESGLEAARLLVDREATRGHRERRGCC